jgi:hypothetical protein
LLGWVGRQASDIQLISSPHPVILDIFHRESIWFFLGGCQQLQTYGIPFTSLSIHVVRSIFDVAGFRPGSRATFDSAKVAKTMLAVMWPFGSPARFADSGGVQTRYAQTMRAFSPVSAARLGNTIRPGETAETMSLLIMEGQLAALRQGPPIEWSVRPWGRVVGVGQWEEGREKGFENDLNRYLAQRLCVFRSGFHIELR